MPKSRKLRPSSTPGRAKHANCQKNDIKTRYCKDTKWYKKDVENYIKACKYVDSLNR